MCPGSFCSVGENIIYTVCPRSFDPFCIVSYNINWVKTSRNWYYFWFVIIAFPSELAPKSVTYLLTNKLILIRALCLVKYAAIIINKGFMLHHYFLLTYFLLNLFSLLIEHTVIKPSLLIFTLSLTLTHLAMVLILDGR